MHKPGWMWRWIALGTLLGCSAGRTAGPPSCGGGSCDAGAGGEASAGGFPYIGPSCTTAQFPPVCWQCVEGACAGTERCLATDCGGYFSCFCACAAGDGACQARCQQTAACLTCARTISQCQVTSCPAQCGADGGVPQTTCAAQRSCASGAVLEACSVTSQGLCQSQYYTVGAQTFACAACGDCSAAASLSGMACP